MSGNRTLHREQIGNLSLQNEQGSESASDFRKEDSFSVWSLVCTNGIVSSKPTSSISRIKDEWMIWTTGSEGGDSIRGYTVNETSLEEKNNLLEASALRLQWKHYCKDEGRNSSPESSTQDYSPSLGGSCLSTTRNYTGEDRNAGDWLLLSLDLSNLVRIWNLSRDGDLDVVKSGHGGKQPQKSQGQKHYHHVHTHFLVEKATGTTAALLSPRLALLGDPKSALEQVVVVALGCLDGTVALISTGIPVFNPHGPSKSNNNQNKSNKIPSAGTVVEVLGSPTGRGGGGGSTTQPADIPLSLEWNPVQAQTLAVGHGNGTVHLYSNKLDADGSTTTKHHRLHHLGDSPVRAVAFATDGNLLFAGNDQGRLCVWDCSYQQSQQQSQPPPPALVHHLAQAHSSWILKMVAIDPRRFCTLGADKSISVWNVGRLHQASHTFQSNQPLWSMAPFIDCTDNGSNLLSQQQPPRLVAGSSNGWVEVYSLEANS